MSVFCSDIGTIRTLDVCIYIVSVNKEEILCFNREIKPYKFKMDTTELSFKLSLITGNYDQVLQMVRSSKLIGQSIISYLHRKGYPEIALHFLEKQDERTRFNLALECCNLDVALDCARVLENLSVWNKLGEMALLLGNHQIVELCYQRTKNNHKLAFLYLVTGNMEKLKKLLKTSVSQGRPCSWTFWIALVTGDVENQIKFLRNVDEGKPLLAYMISLGNGVVDTTAEIVSEFSQEQLEKVNKNSFARNYQVLHPPVPLFEKQENWPRLMTSKVLILHNKLIYKCAQYLPVVFTKIHVNCFYRVCSKICLNHHISSSKHLRNLRIHVLSWGVLGRKKKLLKFRRTEK